VGEATFFRLLRTDIDVKGEALAQRIDALNASSQADETFTLDSADFSLIPGSPFPYWAPRIVYSLFRECPRFAGDARIATKGLATTDDFQFLRLSWEIPLGDPDWKPFAKGGTFSRFHADLHLAINWARDGQSLKDYLDMKIAGTMGANQWSRWINGFTHYYRPGITWPARTAGFSVRVLPSDCIFGHKAAVAFHEGDEPEDLALLLALMNSTMFELLVQVQLARTELARSYEVGLIQQTPIPVELRKSPPQLRSLARQAHDLQRELVRVDETLHASCLPSLVQRAPDSLLPASLALEADVQAAQAQLDAIQVEIDELVFRLYGLRESDRSLVRVEVGEEQQHAGDAPEPTDDHRVEEEPTTPEDLPVRVQNLLIWCVGVAFGRWDVRMALDPTLLPALQGPFDPLPRCAPGALVGPDGLPPAEAEDIALESWLRAREDVLDLPPAPFEGGVSGERAVYPLPIAWDGILVDDPGHPSDIVARVRGVLALLWGERAAAIEREACDILGIDTLRDYFRDPRKGFLAFHIKRYSKSRRKAPIYWLLQSERRNYAIWLYIHRMMDEATYHRTAREYADAKVALEEGRLTELRDGPEALAGSTRRRREREIDQQQKLVAEVTDFRDRLDAIARLSLPPDLNDGVVIGIAPLHELVPWTEARKHWEKLVAGEYEWSTMSQRMRERGLVDMRATSEK